MGDLGQIVPLKFDPLSIDSMRECIRTSDTVYNLMGRMYPTKNYSFEKVHVDLARQVAKVCKEYGSKLVHVSALNAKVDSSCKFLHFKVKDYRINKTGIGRRGSATRDARCYNY
jgi:NADH dehydrogenase (ubiquinone) 1 alpha subcomplex subunit 9